MVQRTNGYRMGERGKSQSQTECNGQKRTFSNNVSNNEASNKCNSLQKFGKNLFEFIVTNKFNPTQPIILDMQKGTVGTNR